MSLLLSWEFFFEVGILLIHPLPYDVEYTFYIIDMLGTKSKLVPVSYRQSDFLFALMFLRVYFLLKTLMNFTIYSDLYSRKVCSKYAVESNNSFYIKALYVKRPGMIITMICSISVLFLSYVLRIFER